MSSRLGLFRCQVRRSCTPEGGPRRARPSSCSSEVHRLTTVVVLAELFEVFESPGALTVTVFVIVPFCVGFTTIVTVADPPSAIVPRSQVTVSF